MFVWSLGYLCSESASVYPHVDHFGAGPGEPQRALCASLVGSLYQDILQGGAIEGERSV